MRVSENADKVREVSKGRLQDNADREGSKILKDMWMSLMEVPFNN